MIFKLYVSKFCNTSAILRNLTREVRGSSGKTCPCKVYPLQPHLYIAKLGYAGAYLLVCRGIPIPPQNTDRGYPLEPPRPGGSNEHPQSMFQVKKKKKKKIIAKKSFTENFHSFHCFKNLRILHGQAFIMCNLLHIDHTVNLFITCWKCINVQCHRNNFHKSRK